MIRWIQNLVKKQKRNRGKTLRRRLLIYFVMASLFLIFVFAILLIIFGITGREEKLIKNHMVTEQAILSEKIEDEFGRISVCGITIAEEISRKVDLFLEEHQVRAADLTQHPELIEPLLADQIHILISTIRSRYCGGVFMMLDATVAPESEKADVSKAGIFIKKTQPTSTDVIGVDLHYLRGPAQIARDHGIMLLGQWKMEYDITDQTFFDKVMETARMYPELPLSRLYYWSGRITLKGNSEAGFLLCIPLRSEDGTVFGLCGIEVSDRLFKSQYSPNGGEYENLFTVMAPYDEDLVKTSQGLIAGNYYLTGKRWTVDMVRNHKNGFEYFTIGKEIYGGLSSDVRLYAEGSPYQEETWMAALLMPQKLLKTAIDGNVIYFIYCIVALLVVSLVVSAFISQRSLRPVKEAFSSIQNPSMNERKPTPYFEINDLLEFLSDKDREYEKELLRLHQEKKEVQSQYNQAQNYITHLADERMPEVDMDNFKVFIQCLHTLTLKERMIFDLYLEGKRAKEIMEVAGINQNTMKYHNKNIYSKLGVSSRKQLLEYAALMKYGKDQ